MNSVIPHISVVIDPEGDIGRFCFFLASQEWRRKRSSILKFYSKLADKIEKGEDEKQAVRKVVSDMYRRYDEKIKDIVAIAEKEFSESEPVFAALAKYMTFPQLGEKLYTAAPTFLTFSPLGDNSFFFSIAQTTAGREIKQFRVVSIGIHEISHFVFFEQLRAWSEKTGITLNDPSIHYFKEALTAAVMDQPEFRKFFDYPSLVGSENYLGNQELHQLFFDNNGKSENIVQFFEKKILHGSDSYAVSLNHMLRRFASVGDILAEKWKLWNDMPSDPEKQKDSMKRYSEPIKLDR
jgi:hypothetical protein